MGSLRPACWRSLRVNSLPFIADVHISYLTVATLRQQGYDILRVADVLPATTPDSEILEFARAENRMVLTQDLDFSALVALGGFIQPSLVTLRLSSAQPNIVSKRLLEVLPQLEQVLIEGSAITIEDNAARFRKLPIR
jgi:predicted nuclease of predicted toxin-antitoxin system